MEPVKYIDGNDSGVVKAESNLDCICLVKGLESGCTCSGQDLSRSKVFRSQQETESQQQLQVRKFKDVKIEVPEEFHQATSTEKLQFTNNNSGTTTALSSKDTESVSEGLIEALNLLRKWRLNELINTFKDQKIDLECFKYITVKEIDNIIPIDFIAARIKFKGKLAEWRAQTGLNTTSIAETLSLSSYDKVKDWMSKNNTFSSIGSSSPAPRDVSPAYFKQQGFVDNLKIDEILMTTPQTKQILLKYNNIQKPFNDSKRKSVIACIAEYFVYNGVHMGTTECEAMTKKIISKFPLESEKSYFIKAEGGGRSRGALYTTYNNKLKYHRLREKSRLPCSSNKDSEQSLLAPESSSNANSDLNVSENKIWLKSNCKPWAIVEEKWKNTFHLRRTEILSKSPNEIFVEWPLLTQSEALRLIDLDFISMYGEQKSLNLHTKWKEFIAKFTKILREDRLSLKFADDLLENLENERTELNHKSLIAFKLLHYKLQSSRKRQINEGESTKLTNISIKDSLNSTIIEVINQGDIKIKYEKLKEKYKKMSCCIQPIIAIEGQNYYIVSDDIFYKTDSFLAALDSIFKLIFVLNIEYSIHSYNVWDFIQNYFYCIDGSNAKSSSKTFALINQLSNAST